MFGERTVTLNSQQQTLNLFESVQRGTANAPRAGRHINTRSASALWKEAISANQMIAAEGARSRLSHNYDSRMLITRINKIDGHRIFGSFSWPG